ncbi:MAG: nucleotidyltransferase domain-containing protein [Candidatus Peribacter sp.]|nr:nucleotidyltransferase domain-containing protein [Candidatus Peribacter sp.]
MNRTEGIRVARRFKDLLIERGYPVRRVVLFGSVAKGTAKPDSDIDIAVITTPFHLSRIREGGDILLLSKDIDLKIETVTLHPEDFDQPFFTLGREIERTGVEV